MSVRSWEATLGGARQFVRQLTWSGLLHGLCCSVYGLAARSSLDAVDSPVPRHPAHHAAPFDTHPAHPFRARCPIPIVRPSITDALHVNFHFHGRTTLHLPDLALAAATVCLYSLDNSAIHLAPPHLPPRLPLRYLIILTPTPTSTTAHSPAFNHPTRPNASS